MVPDVILLALWLWEAGAAPISASVHDTLLLPLTDLPVDPMVKVLAVPQLAVVMLAEPSKEVPLMVRAVARVVAVEAFPVKEPRNVPVALTSPETSSAYAGDVVPIPTFPCNKDLAVTNNSPKTVVLANCANFSPPFVRARREVFCPYFAGNTLL